MTGPRSDRAQRLAKHREEFAFAVAHGLSLGAARIRLTEIRRARAARCSTIVEPASSDAPVMVTRPRSWMDRYENY